MDVEILDKKFEEIVDDVVIIGIFKNGKIKEELGKVDEFLDGAVKDAFMKEFKGDATLGLISSKLTLEGPIIKNKTSFIVSGRRTYVDLLVKPFMPASTDLSLYFYNS